MKATKSGIPYHLSEELIIGLVAPIGTDLHRIQDKLTTELEAKGYIVKEIRITDLIKNIKLNNENQNKTDESRNFLEEKIKKCNLIRKDRNDASILAKYVIKDILKKRKNKKPLAFIVKQLKRREEILLLREVFGRAFKCIGINKAEHTRREYLRKKLTIEKYKTYSDAEIDEQVAHLLKTDECEKTENHGQRLREAFPLADYFMDGEHIDKITTSIDQFLKIIFHEPHIHPTRDETFMTSAYLQALRSASLYRQVGAIIVDKQMQIISVGYNEVPKFRGGFYDESDINDDHRDYKLFNSKTKTPNEEIKNTIIQELLSLFKIQPSEEQSKKLKELEIHDIIEFHRDLHAESGAIVEAAHLGRSTQGATMYVTTFPCHLCAKNIIGAGITRVVYIEPYPKSRAFELHGHAIVGHTVNPPSNRVYFEPYYGIAPRHYLEAFDAFNYYLEENQHEPKQYKKNNRENNTNKGVRFVRDPEGYINRQKKIVNELK